MKKTLSLAFILAFLVTSLLSVTAFAEDSTTADGRPIAKAVYGSPAVDAAEIDPLWDNAPEYKGEKIREGVTSEDTGTRFTFKLMWDEEHLYVLEKVTDLSVQTYDPNHTYANDSTEICLSLNASKNFSYDHAFDGWVGFTPHENTYLDATGDSAMFGESLDYVDFSTNYDETGYVICISYDIKGINETIAWGENYKIGLEVSVNDSSVQAGERVLCVAWSDTTDAACDNPALFGEVYLVNNKDSEIPADSDIPTDASTDAPADASTAESADASTAESADASATESTDASATESAASETASSTDNGENGGEFPWIIVIAAAAVVVIVVVVVVVKKKK